MSCRIAERLGDLDVPDLVSRARRGSLPAFTELVARFEDRLFNFLLRRAATRADAEDLVQETFVRAWQQIGRYDRRWQFSTWLFTIGRRLAADHGRRGAPAASPGRGPADDGDPGAPIADRELCRHIWALADRVLPETQRTALWLRYAEDLSTREIARVLGKSPVMVRVTLLRARKALRRRLATGRDREAVPEETGRTAQTLTGELAC
jgi:RNA polymerase sigma-70 factor (ECF subfamily)